MKIIKSPWDTTFYDLVKSSNTSIKLTAPYVKHGVIDKVLKLSNSGVRLDLVTSFKLANFYTGASDLSAISKILDTDGEVYNAGNLHAKVYLFDDVRAVITSANLTNGGLRNNYEYGILVEDADDVNNIANDFSALCSSHLTSGVSKDMITMAQTILSGLPKPNQVVIPSLPFSSDTDTDVYKGDVTAIMNQLSGWRLEVFRCLQKVNSVVFTTADTKLFVPQLEILFPENKNIEPKIRQQLQELRDMGLVEFVSRGVYRKLWV